MRSSLALAVIFALTACGAKSGSAKLEGHWKGVRADGGDPAVANNALTFALQTDIVAKGNQITISTPGQRTSGTYAVETEDKTSVVIRSDRDPTPETFTFADANTMSWRIDPNRAIVFQRVKE